MNEVIPINRGEGTWEFTIYNPSIDIKPVTGILVITKEHHTVFGDKNFKETLLSIPSQNVALLLKIK